MRQIGWQLNQFEWLLCMAHSALDEQQLGLSRSFACSIAKRRLPLSTPYVTWRAKRQVETNLKSTSGYSPWSEK